MNKKGQTFMNITGLFVLVIFMLLSFYILDVSSDEEGVSSGIIVVNKETNDYTQQLRLLAQSTITIEGKDMTFAQVANKYFELSIKDDSQATMYEIELKKTARKNFKINTYNKNDVLYLKLSHPKGSLLVLKQYSSKSTHFKTVSKFNGGSGLRIINEIYLPVYFQDDSRQIGSDYMNLVFDYKK